MRAAVLASVLALAGCTAAYDADDFTVCPEQDATCADELAPWSYAPPCLASTVDCAVACGDDGNCMVACLEGDPMAINCLICGVNQLALCGRERGCRCEYEDYNCCRRAAGCDLFAACRECEIEKARWDLCLTDILDECEPELRACQP